MHGKHIHVRDSERRLPDVLVKRAKGRTMTDHDAAYLVLAESTGATLSTHDVTLARAAVGLVRVSGL